MKSKLKMSAVTKIFVTHMHGELLSLDIATTTTDMQSPGDHVNGLVGLLCTISAGDGGGDPGKKGSSPIVRLISFPPPHPH